MKRVFKHQQAGPLRIRQGVRLVTPTINGSICVYGITDEKGIVKCGIEQAYRDGKNRLEETYQLSPVPHHHKKARRGNRLCELRTPGRSLQGRLHARQKAESAGI